MSIEKLAEFAKDGDKNLDNLDVSKGFLQSEKPERQWFNKLFNDITTKTNEVVDNIDALPFEGGVLADTFVTGTIKGAGAVARNQRDINSDVLSLADFADKTGSLDSSEKLLAALEFANGRDIYATGTYKIDSLVSYSGGVNIKGDATFDFSAGGKLELVSEPIAISGMAGELAKGAQEVTFASEHGLSEEDVFIVHDAEDFSLNNFRAYYTDGCMYKVAKVLSPTKVGIYGVSPTTLRGSCLVYKLVGNEVNISGVRIIPASVGGDSVLIDGKNGVRLDVNMQTGILPTGIRLERSYDVSVNQLKGSSKVGSAYPIVISNCQNFVLDKISTVSYRHAVSIGGSSKAGSVPSRNGLVLNSFLSNYSDIGVGASDTHGNSINVKYVNCTINSTANLGGEDISYTNCTLYGRDPSKLSDSTCAYAGEVSKGNFSFDNCDFYSTVIGGGSSPTYGSALHIDVGNIVGVTNISITNSRVYLNNAADNRVDVLRLNTLDKPMLHPVHVKLTDITFLDSNRVKTFCFIAGSTPLHADSTIEIDRINSKGGRLLNSFNASNNNLKMRMPKNTGVSTLTSVIGSAKTDLAVNLKYEYPREPFSAVGLMGLAASRKVGTQEVNASISSGNINSLVVSISPKDNTTWSSTGNVKLSWAVYIDEL